MYCEQMMREEGFDDGPEFRLALATDAIWRACRIILDVRMHRGEVSVEEAIDFLVEHTGFERPHATAEVNRYTSTPTYQLSYLLGKVLMLALREDEQRRLGEPLPAPRLPRRPALERLTADQLPPTGLLAGPPAAARTADRTACRSSPRSTSRRAARGSSSGRGSPAGSGRQPTGPSGSPSISWVLGAPLIHVVDFDGARSRRARQHRVDRRHRRAHRDALQLAGGVDSPDGDSRGLRRRRDARASSAWPWPTIRRSCATASGRR